MLAFFQCLTLSGGSGGSVAIHAGGVVTIYGVVSARGGKGGDAQGINMDGWGMASGGGGGGGRIAVTCESYTDEGIVTAKGGEAGAFPDAMAVLVRRNVSLDFLIENIENID